MSQAAVKPEFKKLQILTNKHLSQISQFEKLPNEIRREVETVSQVLPFRVNQYVLDELIDWDHIESDPIFRLVFPQRAMLSAEDYQQVRTILDGPHTRAQLPPVVNKIRARLNPHPAGQQELNVPTLNGQPVQGIQHKYEQTLLFFPSPGQTCHTYCTYCFRWAQFVGDSELRFASNEAASLKSYIETHPTLTDVLFTGGDPMVMKARVLERFIEPLLDIPHLRNIRICTKSLAWWPHRFVSDPDSDDLLRLFERVTQSGKHLALMAHSSHPRELEPTIAQRAVKRIIQTGATLRCQAPLIRGVNDAPEVWHNLWQRQVQLGAVPYYMFVERDTGPRNYFEVPLARALDIFNTAYRGVSGLARTVRGPSMSCSPGKIMIDGITTIGGEKVFVLKFVQGRNPNWAGQIFFAKYDEEAAWIDQLQPAFGEPHFFFEDARSGSSAPHQQLSIVWGSKSQPAKA